MNLTERTNAALAWIDAQLALCNAATDGPWRADNTDVTANYATVCIPRDKRNVPFISAARSGYPAMLELAKLYLDTALTLGLHESLEKILTKIEKLK